MWLKVAIFNSACRVPVCVCVCVRVHLQALLRLPRSAARHEMSHHFEASDDCHNRRLQHAKTTLQGFDA
jgi:hypothetical protein